MGASRRLRRRIERQGITQRRKAFVRTMREATADRADEARLVQDAHTAGYVFALLASFGTHEVLEVTG